MSSSVQGLDLSSEKLAQIEEAGKFTKAFLEMDNLCKRLHEQEEQIRQLQKQTKRQTQ